MAESAPRRVSRRDFVRISLTVTGGALIAACTPQAAAPTSAPAKQAAPAATSAPAKPAAPAATAAPAAKASPQAAAKGFVPSQTVKVGIVNPLSGIYASVGASALNGMKVAIKEFEDKGWKFDVIVEDEKADPTTGLRAVQKLIERDQVNVLLGPISSGVLPALRDPVDQAKVVLSTSQAGTRDITVARCSTYIFRTTPTNYMQSVGFGPWLLKNLGKRAYVLTADYAAGTEIADGIIEQFKAGGGEVVAYAKAPLSTTDYAPFMSPILNSGADFVTGFFAGQNAIDVVKAFHQFGVKDKVKVAYSGYLTSNDIMPVQGREAVEGIYEYLDFSESIETPVFQDWTKRLQAQFPDTKAITVYHLHGYTAAKALLMGVEAAGALESDKIAAAMEKVQFEGPASPIRFNNAHQSPLDFYITQVKDMKHTVVEKVTNQEDPNKSECKLS